MSYVKTTPSKAIKKKELPSPDTEEVDCVLKNTSPKESEPIAFLCEKEYTTEGLGKRRMTDYISAVCNTAAPLRGLQGMNFIFLPELIR